MEKINFFLAEKRLASYKVLSKYLCDDLIIKICKYFTIDKKIIFYKEKINKMICLDKFTLNTSELHYLHRFKSIFYMMTDKYRYLYTKCNIIPHVDVVRTDYLKKKLIEKQKGHYSNYYNTWIKFQYFLSKTKSYNEDTNKYGFKDIKSLSDVLYYE